MNLFIFNNISINISISNIISILIRILEMKIKNKVKTKRTITEIFKGCKQEKYIPILKNKIKFCKFLEKKK